MSNNSLAAGQSPGNNNDINKEQLKGKADGPSEIKTRIKEEEHTNPLGFSTAKKMIHRLLTCDRINIEEGKIGTRRKSRDELEIKIAAFTKEELAAKLGITPKEVKKLKESPNFYNSIINKISLPLIKLYCSTKFVDGEYKSEEM